MKKKHAAVLMLLNISLVVSCEIDDDFGEFSSTDLNPAIQLGTNTVLIGWSDDENLLFWNYSSPEIRILNTTNLNSSVFFELPNFDIDETFTGKAMFIPPNHLALVVDWYGDPYVQTRLYLTNISNKETTMVTDNLDLNTLFDINKPIIASSSSLVAYAMRNVVDNGSYIIETWVFDPSTSASSFVGPGYPVTFSPEGNKLLCHDYSSGTYLYDVNEKKQETTPFTLSNVFNNKVRWNEEGVIEGYIMNNYPTSTIQVHNLTNNTFKTRSTTFNSTHLYLSPSGKKFIDGELSCLSPYLEACPGHENMITLHMVDVNSNEETELLADKLNQSQGQQFFIENLEFSPNESTIAFTQTATLYISQH